MIENVEYNCLPGNLAAANDVLLGKCSNLYSNHYGIWGKHGVRPGSQIKLSKDKIRGWLENEGVTIYYATIKDDIIGYAIAFSLNEKNYGIVTWVTQLVVHKDYRNHGIAKNILFSIWGFSNHYAWGIVSANPYAIRALEKATRRRAIPIRIKKNAIKLRNIGRKNVPFIQEKTVLDIKEDISVINTEFFVEHGNTKEMLINVTRDNVPWQLGMVDEGWEWIAFTFNDQKQISLSQEEIGNMVATSDSVVEKAYSRMQLNTKNQKWMKNTNQEIDFIVGKCDLHPSDLVYDLGCGIGRHSIELARRNFKVIGIDYISENVTAAKRNIEKLALGNINISEGDCRYYSNDTKSSVVLCLYDVIGSYADNVENLKIVKTAYQLLKPEGIAIFSVMNYESTLANAKHTFNFENDANILLDLPASDIMEKSGDVFNSKYYVVDTNSHLVYRKEQFSMGNRLPIELIVRDKRFYMDEIVSLCEAAGFTIIDKAFTNASNWAISYEATNPRAKEILLICKK